MSANEQNLFTRMIRMLDQIHAMLEAERYDDIQELYNEIGVLIADAEAAVPAED